MTQNANYFADFNSYIQKYRKYDERHPESIFQELMDECHYISGEGKDLIRQSYEMAKR